MTSQKAEALAKYTKAHEAGMMSGHWKPLSTKRFNLLTQESELADIMTSIESKEKLSGYLKSQLMDTEKIEEFVTNITTSHITHTYSDGNHSHSSYVPVHSHHVRGSRILTCIHSR